MNQTIVDRREQSATEERSVGSNSWLVAPGVWRLKDIFVNVYIIQNREGTEWVLVDTGLKSTASKIKNLVTELFGSGSTPKAIIMTHAHFDHHGSLLQLAEEWNAPVYCHHQEKPYLTGRASYPPPDPSVGGGAMALMSFAFPKKPINAEEYLRELPVDGTVPDLEDWRWIHTPGHTPGGTRWTWRSCEGTRCLDMVYADSQTPVSADGFLFTHNSTYPAAIADFERGFAVLEQLPCDVLLTPHPEASRLWQRIGASDSGNTDALIDRNACRAYASAARERLKQRIASEAAR